MINPTGKKLEKLLFGIFDNAIEGTDRYNHNGSLWLIFTDEMRWIVEYTKSQTLWYNYYFFKNEMEIIGLDCVDNKDLIQKWFESRYLNINQVKHTLDISNHRIRDDVEDTIQNGVKSTNISYFHTVWTAEDTIQNGVKITSKSFGKLNFQIEDTIQNGVKDTKSNVHPYPKEVRDTIQNGVKGSTSLSASRKPQVEQTIKNGVKNIKFGVEDDECMVEDTIKNGVKLIAKIGGDRYPTIEDTIQNGVKESKSMKQDRTSSHGIFKMVDEMPTHIPMVQVQDVIQEGVKETKTVDNSSIMDYAVEYMYRTSLVAKTIQNGVKHTIAENPYAWRNVEGVIENGVKEVIELPELNPDLNGYGEYYSRNKNMKYPFNDIVEDVIKENNKLS